MHDKHIWLSHNISVKSTGTLFMTSEAGVSRVVFHYLDSYAPGMYVAWLACIQNNNHNHSHIIYSTRPAWHGGNTERMSSEAIQWNTCSNRVLFENHFISWIVQLLIFDGSSLKKIHVKHLNECFDYPSRFR